MPTPRYALGVTGDECQCGRRLSINHCNACGSMRVYSRMNRVHECLDGSTKFVRVQYRCQACSHIYIQEEREFCEAPPVGPVLARQRLKAIAQAKESKEYLDTTDSKIAEALNELQQKPQDEQAQAQMTLRTTLKLEWVRKKVAGKAPTVTADEYVERRLAGELFE